MFRIVSWGSLQLAYTAPIISIMLQSLAYVILAFRV